MNRKLSTYVLEADGILVRIIWFPLYPTILHSPASSMASASTQIKKGGQSRAGA